MGGPQEQRLGVAALADTLPWSGRIHVTGATGWLGRVTLDLLERALAPAPLDGPVVTYASRARTVSLRSGTTVDTRPLGELPASVAPDDLIVHLAFRTREQATNHVAQYVRDNVAITTTVVGAIEAGVAGVFHASSGAVYRDGGGLETDVEANPYGALKHLEELAITEAARSVGASCCIARIFAISGPYMTKPERYALGDLIRQLRAGPDVSLQARGPVYRSYTAAEDVLSLGLLRLMSGPPGSFERFDTGGDVVELAELAGEISRVVRASEANVSRPRGDGAENRYLGDPQAMRALAERLGVRLQTLPEQIRRTADDLLVADSRGLS